MFYQQFFHENSWLHVTNTALYFHQGSMSPMSQYSFQCFMASCCSSTFDLSSFFTFLHFHFHILDCLFQWLSPYFPNFHLLLHYLFFLLNNNLFIVFFNLIFEVYSLEKGSHASYMELSTFFLNAEHFVTKFSPEFSVLFLFYTHFSMPMFGYMSHTHAYISWGVLVAVIS